MVVILIPLQDPHIQVVVAEVQEHPHQLLQVVIIILALEEQQIQAAVVEVEDTQEVMQ